MTAAMTELLDTTLERFVAAKPHGRFLLTSMGLEQRLGRDGLSGIGCLPLRVVLEQLGADPDTFARLLDATDPGSSGLAGSGFAVAGGRALRVEANVPCALKAPLEIALADFSQASSPGGLDVVVQSDNAASVSNQGQHIDSLDAMPGLTVAAGYNSLLDHTFLKRFATAEHFATRKRPSVQERLAPLGFADPEGIYRAIGINVFVFVVDPSRLAGRKAPDSWEALLSERFAGDVVVCGAGDKISGSLMLHVLHHFGEDAVRRLGRNVKAGMHPSMAIKRMGSGQPDCPAVALMPYFFARLAGLRRPAAIVWPGDGAPAMPFFMLVKHQDADLLDPFAAYLEGPDVGRICSGAFFPSLHPDVACPLPDEARLRWLGWESIRAQDLDARRNRAGELFDAGRAEAKALG